MGLFDRLRNNNQNDGNVKRMDPNSERVSDKFSKETHFKDLSFTKVDDHYLFKFTYVPFVEIHTLAFFLDFKNILNPDNLEGDVIREEQRLQVSLDGAKDKPKTVTVVIPKEIVTNHRYFVLIAVFLLSDGRDTRGVETYFGQLENYQL